MNKAKTHYTIRRMHRYMGVILGIQFLAWTVGGLYFSWTKIDEIRGDNVRRKPPLLSAALPLVSPQTALAQLQKSKKVDSIEALQLVDILGKPVYQITYTLQKEKYAQLADALTGQLRDPLSKDEAVAIAQYFFTEPSAIEQVEYLTTTNGHHEYREKPLPAYAVRLKHSSNTTVYVAAELGTVQSFRNDKWRIFDFLWMLHTMDFENRDDMNNWLLRAFSAFGLLTIISGFVLFFVSAKWSSRGQ